MLSPRHERLRAIGKCYLDSNSLKSQIFFLKGPVLKAHRYARRFFTFRAMLPRQIWKNINRLSFFENAILLETKSRSQGKPIKSNNTQKDRDTLSERILSRQTGQYLLDDFALLVSGAGGKDNVCAVCLEINEPHKSLVLRVTRNEGLNPQIIHDLNQFVQVMIRDTPTCLFNELLLHFHL